MSIGLRTLVLNSNYQPVSIVPLQTIPVEDAMGRIFGETCHVVENYDRKILTNNPKVDLHWPSIIARNDKKLVKNRVKLTPENIFFRDEGKCQYCSTKLTLRSVTFDHVIPKSHEGPFTWNNIVCACSPCNQMKGNAKPNGQWAPKKAPYKPDYYELVEKRKKFPILIDDERWIPFLGEWEGQIQVRYP